MSISRKIDSVLIFTRHLTRMPCLWGYLDDLVSLCEKATKMAFSLEETPCSSTGFFTAPLQRHSGEGCDPSPLRRPAFFGLCALLARLLIF